MTWYGVVHFWAALLSFASALWGTWVSITSYGSMWEPWAVMASLLALVILDIYISFTVRHKSDSHYYAVLILLYFGLSVLLTFLSLMKTAVPLALEYIEENWFNIQLQVLPFTTELDEKRNLRKNVDILTGMAAASWVLHLPALYRAYSLIGGLVRLSVLRFAVCGPMLFVIVALAAAGVAIGMEAIEVSQFATNDDPSKLIVAVFSNGVVLTAAAVSLALFAVRGRSMSTYTLSALPMLVLGVIGIVAGGTCISQGEGIPAFVGPRWPSISQFVHRQFADEVEDKYAYTAEYYVKTAGILTMLVAFHAVLYALACARMAFVLLVQGKAGINPFDLGQEAPPPSSSFPSYGTAGASPYVSSPGVALRSQTSNGDPGSGDTSATETETETETETDTDAPDMRMPATLTAPLSPALGPTTPLRRRAPSAERWTVRSPEVLLPPQRSKDVSWGQFFSALFTPSWSLVETVVVSVAVVILAFFVWGCVELTYTAECGSLSTINAYEEAHYNLTVDFFTSDVLRINHTYPTGSINVVALKASPEVDQLQIEISVWATKGYLSKHDPDFFKTVLTQEKLPTLQTAWNFNLNPRNPDHAYERCAAMRATVRFNPVAVHNIDLDIFSANGLVNITGEKAFPPFGSTKIRTTNAPVMLTDFVAQSSGFDDSAHTIDIVSVSGDITASYLVGLNILVQSSGLMKLGSVISGTVASNEIGLEVHGNVAVNGVNGGEVSLSHSLGGTDVNVTTDSGRIICANLDVLIYSTWRITSTEGGAIWLNTVLQGAGNSTIVNSAGGDIHATTFLTNHAEFTTSGAVSLAVVLLGIVNPPDYFPSPPPPYRYPGISIQAQDNAVKVLSLSGSPLAPDAPKSAKIDASTTSGDLHMEIGGGGFKGNFSAISLHGDVIVEDSGRRLRQTVGVHDNPTNLPTINGTLFLFSSHGDVDLAFLPDAL